MNAPISSDQIRSHPSPFFKASCGCIGLWLGEYGDWGGATNVPLWRIIKACDRSYDEPWCSWRGVGEWTLSGGIRTFDDDKTYVSLTPEESAQIVNHLNWLIGYGNHWLDFCGKLKFTIGETGQPPAVKLTTPSPKRPEGVNLQFHVA